MPFSSVIDHQGLLVLLNDKGGDEHRQLSRLEEIGRVSRSAGTPARHDVEMCTRERLVHEHTAWLQYLGKNLEQGTIEKADTHDGVARFLCQGEGAHISHDSDDAMVSSSGGRYRAVDEIHDDHRSPTFRDGLGVTTRAACDIENNGVSRQDGALVDDPRRRRAIRLTPPVAVPRVPFCAVAARIESIAH